mmetsp:Transcript_13813/g.20215  ORF Transcript_13813/g.20215 Transcript_13813/m.20215 type:complete len:179 (+) Transcript_13813:96-632(+)
MSIIKQYARLQKSCGKVFNYQVHSILVSDDLEKLHFTVEPLDGLWKGGRYQFVATLEEYPYCAPVVHCVTPIKHPNISFKKGLCLNLLDMWNQSHTLEDLLQAVLFLFYEPNFEDPLTPEFYSNKLEVTKTLIEQSVKLQIETRRTEEDTRVDFVTNFVSKVMKGVLYSEVVESCNLQ